jgi:hypothetical protein
MRLALILWRGHAAALACVGRKPKISIDERMILMAFKKLQALVDDARAAFARLQAANQGAAGQIANLTSENQALQQQLDAADDAATAIAQPLHDDIASVAPPAPAPEPQAEAPAEPPAA